MKSTVASIGLALSLIAAQHSAFALSVVIVAADSQGYPIGELTARGYNVTVFNSVNGTPYAWIPGRIRPGLGL